MSKEKQAANGKRAWTAEEDSLIRKLRAEDKTFAEIAKALGRHKGSVCTRAYQLGLPRSPDRAIESRVGTVVRPRPGVLIHYAKEGKK